MSVDDWIEAQVPPVPMGFRPWVARALGKAPQSVDELTREAESALRDASAGLGARNGAFDLLVADALATWAAEAALEEDAAERRLEELVRTLAR